jgi:hypothetical protein
LYGLAVTYFRIRNCTLSSAQTRFTVLFGMGRRGSKLLWPPDWLWTRHVARIALNGQSRFGRSKALGGAVSSAHRIIPYGMLTVIGSSHTGN